MVLDNNFPLASTLIAFKHIGLAACQPQRVLMDAIGLPGHFPQNLAMAFIRLFSSVVT